MTSEEQSTPENNILNAAKEIFQKKGMAAQECRKLLMKQASKSDVALLLPK